MTPQPTHVDHFCDDSILCRERHSHCSQPCCSPYPYCDRHCRGYLALVDLLAGLVLFLVIVAAVAALPRH